MRDYEEFLGRKAVVAPSSGLEPQPVHPSLFDFQQAIVRWAVKRGRAAVFADTGLGKTRIQVEWLRQMPRPGLIVAPLAVAEQTIEEAARIGVEVRLAGEQPSNSDGLWITNYEKLHRFDPVGWAAIVLDESSILKSVDGKTRTKLLREWTVIPHRLCCTATPAPNDIAELANHCEFLGVMSRQEMLASYFIHEDGQDWRLKGHAQEAFYRWLATWAVYIRRPSDLGFPDEGFELPALDISERQIKIDYQPDGELFPALMGGIQGRNVARRQSLEGRVEETARLISERPGQWLVWCGLNAEQDALAQALGSDCVSIQGSTPDGEKVRLARLWQQGGARVLVTKAAIFGFGMNFQNCHQMAFLGLGDSWEAYYQAIRRCWRFGQTQPVDVVIVISEAEGRVAQNVWRKEREAQSVAESVVKHLREFERAEVVGSVREQDVYREAEDGSDGWRMLLGDACERLKELPTGSVGLSVYSPPFAGLYVYSASSRDLGNSRNYTEFLEHYRYIAAEMLRVTMPGRRTCVHVQQVNLTKSSNGVIGWRDLRGDIIRLYQEVGWIYHGEICIDTNPQLAAVRSKSKALLFVQLHKDSSWSAPAMAGYIIPFRAPGENPEPVKPDLTNEEWIRLAHPVWYGIKESDTLQAAPAREEKDEKHLTPLQLETIENCIRLWSNRGELVCDPFAGIGSTGYVALRKGRQFVGVELKESYWRQAVRNLNAATVQGSLFEEVTTP